jgi:hypothetical protein
VRQFVASGNLAANYTTMFNREKLPSLLDLRARVCMFWGEVAKPHVNLFSYFLEKNRHVAQEFNQVDVSRGLCCGRSGCRCPQFASTFSWRLGFVKFIFFFQR